MTFLTVATFVAHGLFGCCWHHGHADAEIAVATEAHSGHGDSPSHDGLDSDECDHDDGPCHHEPSGCSKGRCVFVRHHGSAGQSAPFVAAWLPLLSIADQGLADASRAQAHAPAAWGIEPRASSGPLHARLQVWLI